MNLKQAIALITILSTPFGIAGGAAGGYLAIDTRVEGKIDAALKPVNEKVDQIRADVRGDLEDIKKDLREVRVLLIETLRERRR